jgi:RNA recognition motif-containing protein
VGKKLYVGNLPFNTNDQDLAEIFGQVGQVRSTKIIFDRESGRSKGFGFVEMGSEEEAAQAISQFNGAQLNGRPLTVNEARPMAPRAPGDPGFSDGRQERTQRW